MKKISALIALFSLSGCLYAGDISVLESRKSFVERWSSYPITYFDQGSKLVKTEYITDKGMPVNEVLTAYKGYTVVDAKTYRKDFYAAEYLRPNMDGALNGASIPVVFKKNDLKQVVGQVVIDDESFLLVPTYKDKSDFMVLVRRDGSLSRRLGQIRYKRLVLLDADYIPYPADLRLEPVTTSRTEQTEPVKGFDIKYEGIKADRMAFTYLDYANSQGDSGRFENLSYPNKPGIINIRGVGIKVLDAGKQKLDYIILKK